MSVTGAASRLATPRTAIAVGALVFALNVAAIVVMALARDSIAELVRLGALLPTVAIATLRSLGDRLGVPDAPITAGISCVDTKRQWRHAGSVWHNSMVRSVLQTIAAPVTGLMRLARRGSSGTDGEPAAPVRDKG